LPAAQALSQAFSVVAEATSKAVVYIEANRGVPVATGLQELSRDYDLPSTWREGAGPISTGSGVIISADGLVITNHHVVAGADHPRVTLLDRRSYDAEIVGSDARTDIAVLRILGPGPFPWAEQGDSDLVRVGAWVIAIGHPFDFAFTVTTGIISARGRRNLVKSEIQDYLQTDAALNPGSSGGPLFDLSGRVIGIDTAIYTPPGGGSQNSGISFAIPSNMAWRIADELVRTGRVARASLGLTTKDRLAGPQDARPGAEVTRVTPGSPAELAGLRAGDIVTAVDGEPITGSLDLRGLVLARGVRSTLHLAWERQGEAMQAVARTSDEGELEQADIAIPPGSRLWAGLTLGAATAEACEAAGVSPPPRVAPGLLVYAVVPDSPGAIAGLAPGDVLLELGEDTVLASSDLEALAGRRRSVTVHFWREGGEAWAALGGLRKG